MDNPFRQHQCAVDGYARNAHAIDAEVRLYDHLFTEENPGDVAEGCDWKDGLNPTSLEVLTGCKVDPSVRDATPGTLYQFERNGYFCVDRDSTTDRLVFNRTVTLKDRWAKMAKKTIK